MPDFVPPPFLIPSDFNAKLLDIGNLLDVADKVKCSVERIVIEDLPGLPCDSDFKRVAYMLVSKGFKTFQAAQTLCRCGYGSDAMSLCAVLFENVVDLLYLGQSPRRRSLRFMQYEQVEKYYQVRKVLRRKRLPRGRRRAYRNLEARLGIETAKIQKYFPSRANGWSQKSLFERAKLIGAEIRYYEEYWIYCGHKHTLPMASIAWISTPIDGPVELPWYPDIKGVCAASIESTRLFLELSTAFVRLLGISNASELEKLGRELDEEIRIISTDRPELLEP
jgi:Family of unknown function (DUF5677)